MSLADIVNVQITKLTQAVTRQGFGTIMIVGGSTVISTAERVRSYTSLTGMATDGFALGSSEYLAAQAAFSQNPRPVRVKVGRRDAVAPETWVAAIQAIQAVDDDWYGLVIGSHVIADVQAVAAYVETITKLFATSSGAVGIYSAVSTTDIAFLLKASNYARTVGLYSATDTQYPEAAWLGLMLTFAPGSATWKFKSLSGVASDVLTDTQDNATKAKNFNTYRTIAGVPITAEGKVAMGEFIDIIIGIDWLKARMTERIYGQLVNLPKLPFTDAGITAIESQVRAQLREGVDNSFIAADPAFTTAVPKAVDISANDKATRTLNGITFKATLAGAIHATTINGTVQV